MDQEQKLTKQAGALSHAAAVAHLAAVPQVAALAHASVVAHTSCHRNESLPYGRQAPCQWLTSDPALPKSL